MRYILVSACFLGINCRYNGITKENSEVKALLDREDLCLIPVCPEQLGGLPTPRMPSERKGQQVLNSEGLEVSKQYLRGAEEALKIARLYGCQTAILKERSPSCGKDMIYDGSFSGKLIKGQGVTAELLMDSGIKVYGESDIEEFLVKERKER